MLKKARLVAACACLALASLWSSAGAQAVSASPEDSAMSGRPYGRVRAPELTGGHGWLNTDKPLSLAALRGKVVLLDFWTYGCINCIHIIPELHRLEKKYANQLVVIGVHSAKFDNEKETDNIRRIIVRYGIEHPVVNDADFRIWESYAVRAWPTLMIIDPAGYAIGKVEGEGNFDVIDKTIAKLVEDFRRRGELNEQPLSLALERAKVGDLPLAFPGKVLADARTDRLFITDSNHNRIVVTKLDGTFLETIGTGGRGATDGTFAQATFSRPQGLALDGDALYVADTENHLIRRVDLKTRTVTTVAGTGEQQRDYEVKGGAARTTALSSPWDLQMAGGALYIAMAGPHQIWKYEPAEQRVSLFAGTGREARLDGPRTSAAFAQPSGLATDGKTLYVADSESNIIRAIDLTKPQGQVRTLVGGDLFEFGDADGTGDDVRLQHPLGLVYEDGALFVADTYNHKIKRLNPGERRVRTFAGTGKPGQTDGSAPAFYEPGGLTAANGKLYIADTNNHAVRVVDRKSGQTSTLMIRGLQPPQNANAQSESEAGAAPNAQEVVLAPQRLSVGSEGSLVVEVGLPEGYHLNPSAPHRLKVSVESGNERVSLAGDDGKTAALRSKDVTLPVRLLLSAREAGQAELRIQFTLYYCREDNTGTCRVKTLVWRAPIEVTRDAASHEIKAQGRVE